MLTRSRSFPGLQVYGNWLSIPAEISALCVLFEFWTDLNPALWICLAILLTFAVGVSLVRVYGEVEFWFALLKILFIVFLIVLGLVISLGGVPGVPRRGFSYWVEPGAFVEHVAAGPWGRFLGYWAVMSSAVFSFAGTESVAMAAAETRSPRQVIPRACKRVFARVALFYILAVIVVGMLVASDDPRLDDQSGTAAQSPFVIAAGEAGITAIPHVVNAIVITSAWSSANQALLAGTRVCKHLHELFIPRPVYSMSCRHLPLPKQAYCSYSETHAPYRNILPYYLKREEITDFG